MWRRRGPTDKDFREEIEAHLALEADRHIADGLSPEQAGATAHRAFGNATRVRERFYESRRMMWFDDLCQDVRFTLRSVRRSPGFAAIAILTLAIGLGANTAVFSVVNAVLLRPLPYVNSDRLVLVEHSPLSAPRWPMAAWRARARSLVDFTGLQSPEAATLVADSEPVQVETAEVSWNFFPLLGVSPTIGRIFSEADTHANSPVVAVLTHNFWRRQFGGNPEVLGRTITITGDPLVIVGVISQDFVFPTAQPPGQASLFAETQPDVIRLGRSDGGQRVLGRLSPGSTPDAASSELLGIFKQEASPRFSASQLSVVVSPLQERLVGNTKHRLVLLMGAVACVLLVVCANVANLLLARVSNRQPEFAVRAALGASAGRLARLVLTESLLLACFGSIAALLLAYWTGGVIRSLFAERVPQVGTIPIDQWVLAFNTFLAAAVGVLSGFGSIFAVRSNDVANAVTHRGLLVTGRTHLRRVFLTAEVAVTVVLVVTAGLLSQTLWNLYHSNRGFDGTRVITATVMPNMSGTIPELQYLSSDFFENLTQEISRLPGVNSAAAASNVPFSGGGMGMTGVSVVSQTGSSVNGESVSVAAVTPGYFATVGTRLMAGRDFGRGDSDGHERVAIVNGAARRLIAQNQDLVGARINFGRYPVTVIGISEDTPDTSLRQPARPFVYLPLSQTIGTQYAFGGLTMLARTDGADPAALVPAIRRAVWALGHDIVIDHVATMNGRLSASVRTERDDAVLLGMLAAIALLVAMAGVYGVVAYSVVQRTREIGIRVALGARPEQVVVRILRDSAWPVAIGIAIGLTGAVVATRTVASLLFGVQPTDPSTFAATALVLAMTALLAAWIPSRRAAYVDPVTALRAE